MWGPPATPNGVITGYEVMHSVYQNDTFVRSDMLFVRRYQIENLSKGNVCQCVV